MYERSRRLASLTMLFVAPLLMAMASLGTCAGGQIPMTIDVPPRRAPSGIDQMTVVDFEPPAWGPSVSQAIRNQLVEEGLVQVVSSTSRYVLTGDVDAGRVRTTLTNQTVQREVKEDGRKYKKNFTTYYVRKQLEAAVSYQLRSGSQLVAGNTISLSYDATVAGDSPQKAQANALADESIQGRLLNELVKEVVADIAPHRETRMLTLLMGTHAGLRQGIVYMQHGRADQAFDIWNQVIEIAPGPKDTAAAYYNIGVIREARGELSDAFEMFSQADRLVPGNTAYIEAMSRVEERKRERDALGIGSTAPTGTLPKLTIRTVPATARVRIMNIEPRYQPGMTLPPGRYDVIVDAPGFASDRRWIEIERDDVVLEIQLRPL